MGRPTGLGPDGKLYRRGRRREHLVDGELEQAALLHVLAGGVPVAALPAGEVEAVLAVVEARGTDAVDEAAEGLAGVGGPVDGAVGRGGPERGRERRRVRRRGRGSQPRRRIGAAARGARRRGRSR
jgi:hypothetical protein